MAGPARGGAGQDPVPPWLGLGCAGGRAAVRHRPGIRRQVRRCTRIPGRSKCPVCSNLVHGLCGTAVPLRVWASHSLCPVHCPVSRYPVCFLVGARVARPFINGGGGSQSGDRARRAAAAGRRRGGGGSGARGRSDGFSHLNPSDAARRFATPRAVSVSLWAALPACAVSRGGVWACCGTERLPGHRERGPARSR